jgi:hypothetical protein
VSATQHNNKRERFKRKGGVYVVSKDGLKVVDVKYYAKERMLLTLNNGQVFWVTEEEVKERFKNKYKRQIFAILRKKYDREKVTFT